ncbi:MAG TPA: citrate synthase [Methylothermaceae bacterium]|nr:citrate synthase [Methylothermaceae bacterium]
MSTDKPDRGQIQSRNESFTARTATRICEETPSTENPYLSQTCRYHGYELGELMQKRSFVDVLFLLLRGELPTAEQGQLFETLLIGLSNPGPRHAATRAAMTAGVGKTDPAHILPIALSVMGGEHLGGSEVTAAMAFLRRQRNKDPQTVAAERLAACARPAEGDWRAAPGFGSRFGDIDPMPHLVVERLQALPGAGEALDWGSRFAKALKAEQGGWLMPAVAAVVFLDLGFHPRAGAGLFQIAAAPGLLAHGLELANQPRTAMPFPDDDHYFIEA